MANKGILTKSLAVVGAALVWFPLLATILTAAPRLFTGRVFRVDYLMPAELFPFALVGGGLLMWAAFRARSRRGLISWGLVVAVGALFAGQMLAVATGLASGATEPTGWPWALVIASLLIYTLALVEIGVAGALLLRDIFGRGVRESHTSPFA